MDLFASPVLVGHLCAAFQQQPDDAALLFTRVRRAAPSSPGGLNGKMQGRRPRLVWPPCARPAIQEGSYSRQRPRPHSSVQGRHAGAIQGVGIRPNRQEVLDRLSLSGRFPSVGVGRVVKRFRASTIFRPAIGSVRHQQLRDRAPKCRGSHVERCVARIEVVSDVGEEECRCLLTCSAHIGGHRRKSRTASQTPGYLVEVAIDDHPDEIKKDRAHRSRRFRVRSTSAFSPVFVCGFGEAGSGGS